MLSASRLVISIVFEPVNERVPATTEDEGIETTTRSLTEKKCGADVVKTTEVPEISFAVTVADVFRATVTESPTE